MNWGKTTRLQSHRHTLFHVIVNCSSYSTQYSYINIQTVLLRISPNSMCAGQRRLITKVVLNVILLYYTYKSI